MNFNPLPYLEGMFIKWQLPPFWASSASRLLIVVGVLLFAWLIWLLTIKVVYRLLRRLVRSSKATWDDELLERKFFHRLSHIAPAIIIRLLIAAFFDVEWQFRVFFLKAADLAIIASVTLAIIDLLGFVNTLYDRRADSKRRPIKGVIQAFQVLVITAAVIIAFSDLADRPVSGLLAGLGAVSAVLMIIFQEPIKGLVAGFQISSNNMVHIGDWIEMPSQGADGDVIDISLLNVTVRNWDKTYVTFPIQALTNGAFKNWRGMSESGGRRIKRWINIDMSSIHFLSPGEIDRLKSVSLLTDYLEDRGREIEDWNADHGEDRRLNPVNGRALTNVGVFRTYAKSYISSHPKTNPEMTLLVRQLQSGPEGLPIEIYMFSSDKAWANYEDIQSDIFDHLLAVMSEFGLKVFQKPSGSDVASLGAISGE